MASSSMGSVCVGVGGRGGGIHVYTGGRHRQLVGQIVTRRRPGMACSLTEARSHDEGRGGRIVTGVHKLEHNKENNQNITEGMKIQTSRHKSGTGA